MQLRSDFTDAPEVIEANALVERTAQAVTGFKITTPAQYEDSAQMLRKVMAGKKKLEELRTAITGPMNAALKAVNDLFRAPAAKLEEAERSIKREISSFQQEQERLQREEQRKQDEIAQRERDRLAKLQREADAAAAELRRKAEEERLAGNTAAAAALETKAERRDDRAAALEQSAATIVAPVIQREAPKVSGVSTREIWKAEVTDLMSVVKAIAAGTAPLALVQANTTVLGQQARSLRQDFKVPGVRVWSEKSIAAGAA